MAAVAAPAQRVRSLLAEAVADYLLEGETKVLAEEGVDAGIDGGVAVAQPEEYTEYRRMNAVRAKSSHEVHREERQPAEDETTHDYAKCLGRLCLHTDSLDLCVCMRVDMCVLYLIDRSFEKSRMILQASTHI